MGHRGRERQYPGSLPLSGKVVLEMGTASRFLCFCVEQRGAKVVVVAYGFSDGDTRDIVAHGVESAKELAKLVSDRRGG